MQSGGSTLSDVLSDVTHHVTIRIFVLGCVVALLVCHTLSAPCPAVVWQQDLSSDGDMLASLAI